MFHICFFHTVLLCLAICWIKVNLGDVSVGFCHFPIRCLLSGVVLECIDSWSLFSCLLLVIIMLYKTLMLFNYWKNEVRHLYSFIHIGVYNCILVCLWKFHNLDKRALGLVCDVYCDFVTFLFVILGQVWYLILLYTYNWYDFRTVGFLAIWYRKPDQRTEVFWIHISIL